MRIQVIVSAHDHELEIGVCLNSIAEAIRRAPEPWNVGVVVVCDACSDATADVTREVLPDAAVLICNYANAGNARTRGASFALHEGEAQWLAFTHADLEVPPDWLALQLTRANAGFEAAAGLVEIVEATGNRRGPRHELAREGNLGVAAAGYRRGGSFAPWPSQQRPDVLQRLKLRRANICWDTQSVVTRVPSRRLAPAPNQLPEVLSLR